MKSIVVSMAVAAGLMIAGSAMATDMPELAKKNNCTACHAIDKKVVGPAWADVAKKYKGDAGAEAKLITKVSKGGSGVWGSMPMPANDAAGKKQDDMKALVKFVLAL
jgi:cytochrome c